MKKYAFFAFFALACMAGTSCSDDDKKKEDFIVANPTPKEQWSETYKGNDFTVPQLPDLYVNYWEYCYDAKKNANLTLRISGAFPKCRYFSFSTYDETGKVINGMSDYNIEPDAGCVNPFVVTSNATNTYTVYLVPAKATKQQLAKIPSKNIITIAENITKACIIIREYLGIDEYGGVDMPAIQAFDLNTMREVSAPKRIPSNVWVSVSEDSFAPIWSDNETDLPFMLAPGGSFYPNSATNYLFCRTAVGKDQVLTYSLIPAPYPKKVEDYAGAPCRYWSMCYGTQYDTRSYYSMYDAQCNVPDGVKATFVVCLKQNPKLAEIQKAVSDAKAKGQYIFLTVWDSERPSYFGADKPIGNTITTMYRNILPNEKWEHSMTHMTPVEYGDPVNYSKKDPENMQADLKLKEYGPRAKKVTTQEFLDSMK